MGELPQAVGLYDPKLAKVRVARLAARQCGVVARRQLALLGVSDTQIRRWTAGGYLIRRLPGVYAVGHAAPSVAAELTAALLYAGPGAMLTSATGVWWLELSRPSGPTTSRSSARADAGLLPASRSAPVMA